MSKFLYTVQNDLCTRDHLVTLAFENLETPADNQLLEAGVATNTLGTILIGSKIPECDGPTSWAKHRIVIYNRDEGFWVNLFAQHGIIYYTRGEQAGYPTTLTQVPGQQPVQFQAELTITAAGNVQIAATTPIVDPALAPDLLMIVNRLDFAVDFANLQGEGNVDLSGIEPHTSAQVPQNFMGRYIPECYGKDEWPTNRMIVTDAKTKGKRFLLSIFRQYGDLYYWLGSNDYPVALQPIPGGVSQYDNRRKVLILDSPTHVHMRDHWGEPLSSHPSPPPATAYACGTSYTAPAHTKVAGYFDPAAGWGYWLNGNAQTAIQLSGKPSPLYVYVQNDHLPFQSDPQFLSRWMTEFWDYWQYLGGPYVGLRGKWFGTIAIPETHDSMAVMTKDSWLDQIPAAQDRLFREQLFGGVRSFDMRYVWEDALKQYVGSHYNDFEESTMDGCVTALKEFFSVSVEERCHEFIVLKMRYGTGQNNETPEHNDDDAIRMFNTFVEKLRAAGLLDRVLPYQKDASGNALPAAQLPVATLEALNVDTSSASPAYKNLLLTILPDRLLQVMQNTAGEIQNNARYYWASSDVETPGSNPLSGPPFGISILGVDRNDTIFNKIDYPSQEYSDQLASVAVDCMLYHPSSQFLSVANPVHRALTPRNAYGSPYNYNFIAANFFEHTTFVNHVIQLNIFNDRTDVYALDTSTNTLTLGLAWGDPMRTDSRTITIPPGTYYGSLRLAQALRAALGAEWGVSFDGQFTLSAPQGHTLYTLSPTPLSRLLGFGDLPLPFPSALTASGVRRPQVHYLDTDRSLEVFAVGTDRSLLHAHQTVDCSAWSDVDSLGGYIPGDIAVERNADGRLEVFVPGMGDTLYHNGQQPDGSWAGWAPLAGDLRGNPAVVRDNAGRLHVFATGPDSHMYCLSQEKAGGGWPGRQDLAGQLSGDPTAVVHADGHLEVFALRAGNVMQHNWQTPTGAWSGWYDLDAQHHVVGRVAAVGNLDGRIELFARGTDNTLLHNWQTAPSVGPWSGWVALDAQLTSDPTVVRNVDGRLEVFGRGTDGDLRHMWQIVPAAAPWSGWDSLGGSITGGAAVTVNSDSRLEVFARGFGGALCHIWQQLPGGPWSGWKSLGLTPLATTPVCPRPRTRATRWHTAPAALEHGLKETCGSST